MGRQQNIKLKKTVGQIEYYESKGRFFVRSKPANIKQTVGTISRANDFGKASALAKAIRLCAAPILPFKPDRLLINRLTKNVYTFLCNKDLTAAGVLLFITAFEFNESSKISERCKINISAPVTDNTGISIQLPTFNAIQQITAPAYTKRVTMQLATGCINLKKHALYSSSHSFVTIDYSNNITAAKEIKLPAVITQESLLLLMMALKYETHKNNITKTVTDLRWMPVVFCLQLCFNTAEKSPRKRSILKFI